MPEGIKIRQVQSLNNIVEQVDLRVQSVQNQRKFIHQLFRLTARNTIPLEIYVLYSLSLYPYTRTLKRANNDNLVLHLLFFHNYRITISNASHWR